MAVAYVGSAANGVTSTSNTVTYTPVAGNTIVAYLGITTSASAFSSLADNNSNALSVGPTVTNGTRLIKSYYGTAITGATSYTISWTGSVAAWLNILEYSGVSSVNTSLTGNTNTGNSTAPTITCTTLVNNSWLAVGFTDTTSTTWTATTGNLRIKNTTAPSNCRSAGMDNTVVTAGSVTCTAGFGITPTVWAAVALELNPSATQLRELMLLGVGI